MNFVLIVVLGFLLFPALVSGLVRLSNYVDDRTMSRAPKNSDSQVGNLA